MAVGAARELDVLLPTHHLPDRFGLGAGLVPDVDGEDHRVAARLVVEHRLDRRVGVDAAVPVRLAVDAHRRERRRQGTRGHDVVGVERLVAAVEVAHLAAARIDRAHRQPRVALADVLEVDQRVQGVAQRRRAVVGRLLDADHRLRAAQRRHARREEGRDAARHGVQVGEQLAHAPPGEWPGGRMLPVLDAAPEVVQPREPVAGLIAGDQRRVDRADRRADDPVGLDAGFVQRLVDAHLVGAECAAALQHEHDLAGQGAALGIRFHAGLRWGRVQCTVNGESLPRAIPYGCRPRLHCQQ